MRNERHADSAVRRHQKPTPPFTFIAQIVGGPWERRTHKNASGMERAQWQPSTWLLKAISVRLCVNIGGKTDAPPTLPGHREKPTPEVT